MSSRAHDSSPMFYNSANDSYDLRGMLGHRLEMVADDVMSDSAAIFVSKHDLCTIDNTSDIATFKVVLYLITYAILYWIS
jgi:hypothetical protein